jgi:hypothetical protein
MPDDPTELAIPDDVVAEAKAILDDDEMGSYTGGVACPILCSAARPLSGGTVAGA